MAGALTPEELADLGAKLAKEKAKLPAPGVSNFCRHWPEAKTLLKFLHDLPGMPQKAKAAIETVISVGDKAYSIMC